MTPPARQAGLGLDDPRRNVPTRPTLFTWSHDQVEARRFDDLTALARAVHDLAGGRGLRLAGDAATMGHADFDSFRGWAIYALDDAGETWLCAVAMQDTPRDLLEARLRREGDARRSAAA